MFTRSSKNPAVPDRSRPLPVVMSPGNATVARNRNPVGPDFADSSEVDPTEALPPGLRSETERASTSALTASDLCAVVLPNLLGWWVVR